jgi:hypothetical protein
MTNPTTAPNAPPPPDPPHPSSVEAFLSRLFRFFGHVAVFVCALVLGVFGQTLLLIPFGGFILQGGAMGGMFYAVLCGIPSSGMLIFALRRRREAHESGLSISVLEHAALLGLASTALVYGICAGAMAVSEG